MSVTAEKERDQSNKVYILWIPVRPSVRMSIRPSIRPSVRLSIRMYERVDPRARDMNLRVGPAISRTDHRFALNHR